MIGNEADDLLPKEPKEQHNEPWQVSEGLFRQIVEETWEMLSIVDVQGKVQYASAGFERIVGFNPENVQEFLNYIAPEYRMDARKLFHKAVHAGRSGKLELKVERIDQSSIWLEAMIMPIKPSEGPYTQVAVVCNDITTKKTYENKLLALAYHDPLTGLPNRRLFKEHLTQALSQARRTGKPLALLYLDIDDFKYINDTMGHDVGDQFLVEFAKRIRGCLREIDTFARMGGDEFTILLPAFEAKENVEMIAKRIFRSLEKPWCIEHYEFTATVSMGIILYPDDGVDASSLLKQVDSALYQVKGTGRNRYQFYRA